MTTKTGSVITVRIDRAKLIQTALILPVLMLALAGVAWGISDTIRANTFSQTAESKPAPAAATVLATVVPAAATYPQRGADLNVASFALRLPPPPLDALPYDVRKPLYNGTSVPVKKRWMWLPAGQSIVVAKDAAGQTTVTVPTGALWWKEFYVETDRGTFLIERRIIARVGVSRQNPDGWAYYTAHYQPGSVKTGEVLTLPSTGTEAAKYVYQPTDWLPTQVDPSPLEVRFGDDRGTQHPFVFPGQTNCLACHSGASGAFPNSADDPITVFGFHPNNLTPDSLAAAQARGWIQNADDLLTPGYLKIALSNSISASGAALEETTTQLVAVLRNNCASCHNASPNAMASFTSFIVDPNRNYSPEELRTLLSVTGKMMPDAKPLVTPGQLDQSEVWLRLNGLEGRRRMPPVEGGLPELEPRIVDLWQQWILMVPES